jgi:transposase
MKKKDRPTDWREVRRLRAWELHEEGWQQCQIAEALGVTAGAVSQWLKRAREGGVDALRARVAPGPTPRLTAEQREQLPELLKRGAEAYGFRGELWTSARVAEVIRREFAVSYHRDHVGRILRECGWSVQKPVRRASQRDEGAIERWRSERWPEVKKRQ